MIHLLHHSLLETVKTAPYLFVAYLLIEWLTHRAGDTLRRGLGKFGVFGSLFGAVAGLFPQCGFSIMAANLYADRLITPGTLLAIFISTSDEAIPLLLSRPEAHDKILPVLAIKFTIAVVIGLAVDLLLRRLWLPKWQHDSELNHHHHKVAAATHREHPHPDHHEAGETEIHKELHTESGDEHCTHTHCHGSIWLIALRHTLTVSAILFVFIVIIHMIFDLHNQESVEAMLMKNNFMQPVLAAAIGLIPSCAPSVLLTYSYLDGAISFGSVIAGLTASAGTGTLILFQACRKKTEAVFMLLILFCVGVLSGILIDFF